MTRITGAEGPAGGSAGDADILGRFLRGQWHDPDTGMAVEAPPIVVKIEPSLAGREAGLVAPLGLGGCIAVVSDVATHAVLGARVADALGAIATVDPVVLGPNPHADLATVERLRAATRTADALVAVGSGTVNDLCKFVAAQDRKRFVVFPTAPSMNGYTSANASITVDGHKSTLPATLACAVFVDIEVLCAAPPRMIRAGLGDSLCRSTAQADWLLSHYLFATRYRNAPFALLAADESTLLDSSAAIVAGDSAAMLALARTLLLSGLGMTLCGGSYPASQGEHLISHYIDTFAPQSREAYLHGEQIGVATLTMARLQQAILSRGAPRLRYSGVDRSTLTQLLGETLAESCWDEFSAKETACAPGASLQARVNANWDEWCAALAATTVGIDRLDDALGRAGAPRSPADIGLSDAFYAKSVASARYLRDRFTFLDLAACSGIA